MSSEPASAVPTRLESGVLAPIRRASGAITAACLRTATVGWTSAGVIVASGAALAWPLETAGWIVVALTTSVLAVPGALVYLLAQTVAGVARLPDSLMAQASSAPRPPISLEGGPLRSAWRVARYLVDIRGRLWAMRDELVAAGAVLRLASPFVLLSVLGAVVAIGVMIPVAALMLVLALLF